MELKKKLLFNPDGDTDPGSRRIIGGNTTNLNDFNNMKYQWASGWYRQAMNNFWIPEEINLGADVKAVSYTHLDVYKRQVRFRCFPVRTDVPDLSPAIG